MKIVLAVCLVGLALGIAVPAARAQAPQWEIYGGADFLHANACPIAQELRGTTTGCSVPVGAQNVSFTQNFYGWHASLGENAVSWFGLVFDFSGDYANRTVNFGTNAAPLNVRFDGSAYPFLFGPRFYYRKLSRASLFGEPLIGGVHIRGNFATGASPFTETKWAYAFGGGVDFKVSNRLSIRGQGDWIRSHFPETAAQDFQNNFRGSVGLVLTIGDVAR